MNSKEFAELYHKAVLDGCKTLGDFSSYFASEHPIKVSSAQDIISHRWYSTAVDVYFVEDAFLGIRAGYQLFTESAWWSDIEVDEPELLKYKAKQTISYVRDYDN